MPADERARLRWRKTAEFIVYKHPGSPSDMIRDFAQALRAADQLAREDAARIADGHNENGFIHTGITAAIRASITTDEGK